MLVEAPARTELRLEVVLRDQGATGTRADDAASVDLDARALEAGIDRQAAVGELHVVEHVELAGIGIEALAEHALVRIAVEEDVVRRRVATQVVEIALHAVRVLLQPQAGAQLMIADAPFEAGHDAGALDVVFGGAHADRHVRRGRIRRGPVALALVAVIVGRGVQREVVAGLPFHGEREQIVVAHAARDVVRIVEAVDATGEDAVRGIDRALPVAGVVVPVVAEATRGFEREVGVVGLAAARGGGIAGDFQGVGRVHGLAVELRVALRTVALPLVAVVPGAADVGREIALAAAVHAHEGARGRFGADGLRHAHAEVFRRLGGEEAQRAAQVAGGRGIDRAAALRQFGAVEVLADDRAADMQAVVVAVAHVAQRDAVEREAELLLRKAADAQLGRPLVVAPRVGTLEIHARQLRDGLERAGAGCFAREVVLAQRLHLAGLAGTDDGNGVELGGAGVVAPVGHGLGGCGAGLQAQQDGGGEDRRLRHRNGIPWEWAAVRRKRPATAVGAVRHTAAHVCTRRCSGVALDRNESFDIEACRNIVSIARVPAERSEARLHRNGNAHV